MDKTVNIVDAYGAINQTTLNRGIKDAHAHFA